jgi:hypothetical protein
MLKERADLHLECGGDVEAVAPVTGFHVFRDDEHEVVALVAGLARAGWLLPNVFDRS